VNIFHFPIWDQDSGAVEFAELTECRNSLETTD